MNVKIIFYSILTASLLLIQAGCKKEEAVETENTREYKLNQETDTALNKSAEITFIELGSDKCIPCIQMQPVLKSIQNKYGDKVEVIFYDVWKDKESGRKYNIKLIPTQIFLDENGNEFFRHEGFYPENDIISLFETKGLKQVIN